MTSDPLATRIVDLGDDPEVRAILTEVCRLTGMGFSAVAHVTDERWIACQVEDSIDFGLDPGGELEVRKTICNEIRLHGQVVMIDDTANDPDWWSHPVPVLYGFRSYVSLPITLDDGAFFGTLCSLDPAPRKEPIGARLAELEALARKVAAVLTARMADTAQVSAEGERLS